MITSKLSPGVKIDWKLPSEERLSGKLWAEETFPFGGWWGAGRGKGRGEEQENKTAGRGRLGTVALGEGQGSLVPLSTREGCGSGPLPGLGIGTPGPPFITPSFPPPPPAPPSYFNTPLKIEGAAKVWAAPETDKR